MCLIIFGALWMMRKRIQVAGLLFSVYLIFNGIERYLIEQIRVNVTYNFAGINITQAEIIALLFIFTGIGMYFYFKKKKLYSNPT
jgi:prolipoprotein diacylglyceryltransferase